MVERDLIRERARARLAAARARGRVGGRPKKLADPTTRALAQQRHDDGQTAVAAICRTRGISRATRYRSIDRPEGRHRAMNDSDKEL